MLNEVSKYTANAQKNAYDTYKYNLGSEAFDTSEVDIAYSNGVISEEQYDSLKADYNTQSWNKFASQKGFDAYDTYAEAKESYDSAMSDSWLSDETKEKIQQYWEKAIKERFRQEAVDSAEDMKQSGFTDDAADSVLSSMTKSAKFDASEKDGYIAVSAGTTTFGGYNDHAALYFYTPDGNSSYTLQADAKVEDDELNKALNKLATGDENVVPEKVAFGRPHTRYKNRVVLYNGTLYIYFAGHGDYWCSLKGDNVDEAIKAYLEMD